MDIDIFRYVSMVLWAAVCAALIPSPLRMLAGRQKPTDDWKTALFFVGLLMIGFIGRWVLFPEDQMIYRLLYVLNCMLAFHVILLLRNRSA